MSKMHDLITEHRKVWAEWTSLGCPPGGKLMGDLNRIRDEMKGRAAELYDIATDYNTCSYGLSDWGQSEINAYTLYVSTLMLGG